jgi:protein SCO1
MRRRVLLALPLAALVLACASCGPSSNAAKVETPPPSPYRGFVVKPPTVAPAFRLRDQARRMLGAQDERGHWLVVTFMYTHCPDVCPLVANNLQVAMQKLPDLRVLAVSVDPAHDTPAAVRAFLRRHRLQPRFRYLTGTHAQLAPVWAKYHIASTGGPHDTVSHSSFEILVDPRGRERLIYDAQFKAADLLHDLPLLERA